MFLTIMAYNTAEGVHWRMASCRPASAARGLGLYVWETSGDVSLDPAPVTSRAVVQAVLDELQRCLGERQD